MTDTVRVVAELAPDCWAVRTLSTVASAVRSSREPRRPRQPSQGNNSCALVGSACGWWLSVRVTLADAL